MDEGLGKVTSDYGIRARASTMSSQVRRSAVIVLSVSAAMLATPTAGLAVTRQHAREYEQAYHAVAKKFGHRAPGRNLVRWGTRRGRPATEAQVATSLAVLRRMLAPPPAPVAAAPVSTPTATPTAPASTPYHAPGVSVGSPGPSGLPACASESGTNYSTGPANTNPSSGATGRYQVIGSTHAALCSDLGWSPGEQDQCALRIYQAQGSGAWVGCGG